ncbi:MAG: hypothetical protein J7M05_06150 [Anaerolineae bacterium]|nr:hypothetical protein [Anaerolineae bacterium]
MVFEWIVVAVIAVMAFLFMFLYDRSVQAQARDFDWLPEEIPSPPKKRGLVLLFSKEEPAQKAIDYHQERLERCWLFATPQMRARAEKFARRIERKTALQVEVVDIPEAYQAEACYDEANKLFGSLEAIARGEVIADITGGTKPMTVGLFLACLRAGIAVQYVLAPYDKNGNLIPGEGMVPVEIRVG